MPKTWKNLKDARLSPDVQARMQKRVEQDVDRLTLRGLRQRLDLTQTEVGKSAQMTQSELSRLESRSDHLTSTLRRYVEALGVWLGAARSAAGAGNRRLFERTDANLKSRPELASALSGPLGQASWAERSIALVRSVSGITSVLVGMRSLSHVDAALASLKLEVPQLQELPSADIEAQPQR